jgi:hypothetical protein
MQEFATPNREAYYGSKRGEEFLVKHMLETNRSAAQILKESPAITRQATLGLKLPETSEPFTSRSAQMYPKRNSISKESEAGSLPAQSKKPSLSRMRTVENVGTFIDDRHEDNDQHRRQLDDLRAVVGDKNRGLYSLGNTGVIMDRLDHRNTANSGQNLLRNTDSPPKNTYQMSINGNSVSPIVAQRSAKIDQILQDWEAKLAVSQKKLAKDKQAKEVLSSDLTLMEEELRKVKAKLLAKTEQLNNLDSLLADTKDATERITRSMQGLTTALEREKQLKFK